MTASTPPSPLSYIHTQDVIKQIMDLGPGALLVKIDIKSAYRIIPVHPSDRPLLGMSFQHQVYIDASLSFGLRSAPKIFNSLADPNYGYYFSTVCPTYCTT